MSTKNINSVISVLPVKDFDTAFKWYRNLFGRDPDVAPMEGIAEWQLVENAWFQVAIDPEHAGNAAVIVGVDDIEVQCKICTDANISVSEIVEYPELIKIAEIADPAGNKISFVQDISNNSGN